MKYSGALNGMVKDLDELNLKPENYTFALNAYIADKVGDEFFLQNGASNLLGWVFEEGENVLGRLYVPEIDVLLLFTDGNKIIRLSLNKWDDTQANIPSIDGLTPLSPLEERVQTPILSAIVLVQSSCFNWNIQHKLDIEYKITPTTLNIYIFDGYNEDKYLYFDRDAYNTLSVNNSFKEIISIDGNGEKQYGALSCNKIRRTPDVSYPEVSTIVTDGGKLLAGVYQVMIAYATSKGIELTPYKAATNPIHIFTKTLTPTTNYDSGKALQINISNLEVGSRYQFINVVVVSTIDGVTTYRLVATNPISPTQSYLYTGEGISIPKTESEIFSNFIFYKNAKNATKGNNKLFLSNLKEYEKINIQRIANLIKLKWFTVVAKEGEYKKPEFAQNYKSVMRDEVMAYGFKLILDNGEETHIGHIPGPEATDYDREIICRETEFGNNNDVIVSSEECKEENCKERWQVYNTAKQTAFYSNTAEKCSYPIHSEGTFAYWKSTDLYPNDRNLFGDLANTPIRHHKFPDCLVSPMHDGNDNMFISFNGSNKIYPLGIKVDVDVEQVLNDALAYGWITQEQRNRIVGYKIVRGNRASHKSIIAKGLLYDTYKYRRNKSGSKKYIYPNYPFNDLRPDPYLSGDDPDIVRDRIRDGFQADLEKNKFENEGKYIFHSPDTHFNQPTIPSILKIENEVYGDANGFFNKSEGQAKYALLDVKWYNLAIVIGSLIAGGLSAKDSNNASDTGQQIGGAIGSIWGPIGTGIGTMAGKILGGFFGGGNSYNELAKSFSALSQAEKVIQLFQNILQTKNYHYQYQAIGKYSNIEKVENSGNKQRNIVQSEYVEANGRQTIGNEFFNNFGRESSVYLEVDKILPSTKIKDNSRFIISEKEGCDYTDGKNIKSTVSSYYGSLKRNISNQYGTIFDIEYIPVSNKVWKLNEKAQEFGGDTFIGRMALKRKHHFFTNTTYGLPDGSDFFYDELYNQGIPLYYFNTKYYNEEDILAEIPIGTSATFGLFIAALNPNNNINMVTGDGATGNVFNSPEEYVRGIIDGTVDEDGFSWNPFKKPSFLNIPNALKTLGWLFRTMVLNPFRLFKQPKMSLDCYESETPTYNIPGVTPFGDFIIHDFKWKMKSLEGKIYTYSYGIPYFLCESDVNLDLRYAINTNEHDFYPNQKDLNYWLQQEKVSPMLDNTYYYNRTYSKQNKEEINIKYDIDFIESSKILHHRNRVIYSEEGADVEYVNLRDNYLYFRPLNSHDFSYEKGLLTSIDVLENENILIRFENEGMILPSFDTLKTGNGLDVTLGTGGVFNSRRQEFSNTPLGFLGSQHTAILSTEFGHVIVDAKRGQIFKLGTGGNGLEILSNKGMKNWFKEHLPFHINKYIKNVDVDNEYNGVGIVLSFNKRYDGFHLTKKDYIPKIDGIEYTNGKYFYNDVQIYLEDDSFFCDASWTISYSFSKQSWVSFHTFTPNYYVDMIDVFYTGLNGNNSSLWVHNLTNKSYQVYYGELHPFIVEGFSQPTIHHKILSHVSYLLTVERYSGKYDAFVRELIPFNKAIVYNETQNSGLLELEMADERFPFKNYPIINIDSRTIKVENKEDVYSFNQFDDVAYTNLPRFKLSCSGVLNILNCEAINYKKLNINNGFMSNNINFVKLINDKYSNFKMVFKGFLLNETPSIR